MKTLWAYLIFLLISGSCQSFQNGNMQEIYKQEVIDAENAFSKLAGKKGITTAFLEFADEHAVLMRGDQLIKGKEAIETYLNNNPITDAKLEWTPDFVDVSVSGDLAYTYGYYTFSMVDSAGQKIEQSGIFHTVWKRQDDGTWRFVWD